jgi:hypothetical protein
VRSQNFLNLASHGHDGIERERRVLRNPGYLASANCAQFRFWQAKQVAPVPEDFSPFDPRVRGQQSQDGMCQCAFAASGFSQNSENFAAANFQTDNVQCAHVISIGQRIRDVQPANLEKGVP